MTVPPELLHLDLCTLAYQLYHQSLVWPLDPFYEFVARLMSDRRDTLMARVHAHSKKQRGEHYAGPASLRGLGESNTTLDPVLTHYGRLAPRLPAWTRDGSKFLAIRAPGYVADRIRKVSVSTHAELPRGQGVVGAAKVTTISEHDSGWDHLIAFEGGTGSFGGSAAAWSLMGYVLKRAREGGGHDIHIVFRGSRSGSAVRAAAQGVSKHKGNADWVTDTDVELVSEPLVSSTGKVARGFATALKTCFGTIQAALSEMHRLYGPPKGIGITGHSLGAALAAQLSAAIVIGEWGVGLRNTLADWPWGSLRGFFMAEPPVGDRDMAAAFDARSSALAPYVVGDAIVECSAAVAKANNMMGKVMSLAANGVQIGTLTPMARVAGSKGTDDSHETYMIRGGLLAKHGKAVPAAAATVTAWAAYDSFTGMLGGVATSWLAPGASRGPILGNDDLAAVLANYRFAEEFETFLAIYRDVVTDPDAYSTPKLLQKKSDRAEKVERLDVATSMIGKNDSDDPRKVVDATITQVLALAALDPKGKSHFVQGASIHKYLGLGLVLGVLERSRARVTMAHVLEEPELRECLDATWSGLRGLTRVQGSREPVSSLAESVPRDLDDREVVVEPVLARQLLAAPVERRGGVSLGLRQVNQGIDEIGLVPQRAVSKRDLEGAVTEQKEAVAGDHGRLLDLERGVGRDPHHGAADRELDALAVGAEQEGRRVRTRGVGDAPRTRVEHGVPHREVHAVLRRHPERAVQGGEHVGRTAEVLGGERLGCEQVDDGDPEQRGAHAVATHVEQIEAEPVLVEPLVTESVTPQHGARDVVPSRRDDAFERLGEARAGVCRSAGHFLGELGARFGEGRIGGVALPAGREAGRVIADARDELDGIGELDEVVVGTAREGLGLRARIVARGEHHDGDVPGRVERAKEPEQHEAIDAGHDQILEDDGRPDGRRGRERERRIGAHVQGDVGRPREHVPHRVADDGLVVDEEDDGAAQGVPSSRHRRRMAPISASSNAPFFR
jgi:hypothetical protein